MWSAVRQLQMDILEEGEHSVLQKAQPQEPECTGFSTVPALAAKVHVVTQICSLLVNVVQFGT